MTTLPDREVSPQVIAPLGEARALAAHAHLCAPAADTITRQRSHGLEKIGFAREIASSRGKSRNPRG
jgi:hypothetical protein